MTAYFFYDWGGGIDLARLSAPNQFLHFLLRGCRHSAAEGKESPANPSTAHCEKMHVVIRVPLPRVPQSVK
jgi:hypothetical protein